jgi:hypothetical protein
MKQDDFADFLEAMSVEIIEAHEKCSHWTMVKRSSIPSGRTSKSTKYDKIVVLSSKMDFSQISVLGIGEIKNCFQQIMKTRFSQILGFSSIDTLTLGINRHRPDHH